MAQQNKNSSQPQGFAGFDDLISEFSEDVPVPPQPKAQAAKPVSVSPSPPPQAKPVTPAPTPPRTDPPKPSSPPPQAPVKTETRVVVEPKPVPSSLPKAAEEGSQKALWFSVACGVFFLIWLVSGPDKSQTSSRTVSNIEARYEPVTTQSITRTEPIYKTKTPLITEKNKSAPEKPPKPKAELDPLVKKIQQKLLSLGYSPGSADGYIGQKTLNAIRQFQKENRLPIDSKVNEELLSSLDRAQPRIIPQRRQESPQSRSVKNKKEDSVCPTGEICVRDFRESFSSSSDDKEISTQEQKHHQYGNPNTSSPQTPVSSPSKNSNARIVCPTNIFCYPKPY